MLTVIERSDISDDVKNKIVSLFKSDNSIGKISSIMRMRDYMVRCILIEQNHYSGRNALDGFAKNDIIEDKKLGMDNATLAKLYYVPEKSISKLCVEHGFRKNHNLNDDDMKNIVSEYKKGANVNFLSNRYGVSYGTIKRCVNKAGITVQKHNKPKISDGMKKRIIRYYENGMGMKPLAKKYSYSVKVIRNILVENNVEFHSGKVTEEMTKKFVECYENGDPIKCISYEFDITEGVIRDHLRKNGIKIKREHHHLTNDERKLLQKDKKDGMTEDELVEKYKVHKATVKNILKRGR